jgi:hypothetical protein
MILNMASPVPTSPSLFVSDDESDRSSKRGFHDFLSDGPADLDNTTNTRATRPVTPRKRRRNSKRPERASLPSFGEDSSDETADLSPIAHFSIPAPSITTCREEGRHATGTTNTRLTDFTDMQRTYMIVGARNFAIAAEKHQQEIANDESRERDTLQDLFDTHEHFLKSAQADHDFPQNLELLENYTFELDVGDSHIDNALAVHNEVMAKTSEVRTSLNALLQTLKDASRATKQIMVDHAEAWDQKRAEAAQEVEKHRFNLRVLEQGL